MFEGHKKRTEKVRGYFTQKRAITLFAILAAVALLVSLVMNHQVKESDADTQETAASDTDETWRGADSKQLLLRVLKDERVAAWRLVNLDCTIIAERPKLMAHKEAIRASLAALFGCDVACVSVKAKTHEKLDSLGAGEALSAIAVILLEKKNM